MNSKTLKEMAEMEQELGVFGDNDMFELLCGFSSEKEGVVRTDVTRAMELVRIGCLVRVTTMYGDQIAAEATTLVPGVSIAEDKDNEGKLVGRHLKTW